MRNKLIVYSILILLTTVLVSASKALAHCDAMDGPVIKAAQRALVTKNVNLVLIWVQKKDEPEIKRRFQQTLEVRRLNREARELADNYFFETVVRLHRAGEGEPYTGIKPAGTDFGPVVQAADEALHQGSLKALLKLFPVTKHSEIQKQFDQVVTKRGFEPNNVDAGREYVKAYVSFLHYLEHLYEMKSEEFGKKG